MKKKNLFVKVTLLRLYDLKLNYFSLDMTCPKIRGFVIRDQNNP